MRGEWKGFSRQAKVRQEMQHKQRNEKVAGLWMYMEEE